MARGDIQVLNPLLYGTSTFRVEDRDTSTQNELIKSGEILNKFTTGTGTTAAAGGNLVGSCIDPGANGIGIDGTDLLTAVAKEESTESATASGTVVAWLIGFGVRLGGRMTTPGNANTTAELNGILLDNITIDGITTKAGNSETTPYTFDENDTDDPNIHAFQILVGDIVAGTLECRVVAATSMFGVGI